MAGHRSPANPLGRLSVGALGVGLVGAVGVAAGTGLLYLSARLGVGSPVRLDLVDGVHVYSGLVGGALVLAKVVRLRSSAAARRPTHGRAERWVSRSMLVLYAVGSASGVLALVPAPERLADAIVQVHLMTSVWVALPTSWHLWHHRRRALRFLARTTSGARASARPAVAVVLVALPALGLAFAAPRAATALSGVDGGGAWRAAALTALPVERIATTPDGRVVLAAGGGALHVSRDGITWAHLALPVPTTDAAPGFAVASGHGHVAGVASVQALVVSGRVAYIGTSQGLYGAALSGRTAPHRLDLPGRALDDLAIGVGYPGTDVRSIAVRGVGGRELWTAGSAGALHSVDAGRSWVRQVAGLAKPAEMAAVAFLGAHLFGSDGTGVYEWMGDRWRRSAPYRAVTELAANQAGRLFAASRSGRLAVLDAGRWRTLTAPTPGRAHQRHDAHPSSTGMTLASAGGRLYAAGNTDGVSASGDGGQTWTAIPTGPLGRAPRQVAAFAGGLWAVTDHGLYRRPLTDPAGPPTALWWLVLTAAALLATAGWLVLVARDRSGPRVTGPARA